MTTYVDSSALLKRYVDEVDSDAAEALIAADPVLVTSWITQVEVRRNLARLLTGNALLAAQRQFTADLDHFALISCDERVSAAAAMIGETLGVRSLDAIHLGSLQVLQLVAPTLVSFDLRQAQAGRSLGFVVRGA